MNSLSHRLTWMLVIVCSASLANAQRPKQYKRVHQDAFKKILNGESQEAIQDLGRFIEKYPDDEESHFMLAVAHASQQNKSESIESVRRAIDAGLPPGRVVGGTLTGLDELESEATYADLRASLRHDLVHGPMLGDITGESVRVWVRTALPAKVQVVAVQDGEQSERIESAPAFTSRRNDLATTLHLNGLKPQTKYSYRVWVDGEVAPATEQFFTTPAAKLRPAKFRIAFGGGAGYVPEHEKAWTTIAQTHPDLLMLLGDNVYSDDPSTPAMQHYCYYRRQSRPEFRRLIRNTPVYSIWDDHDFGTNDCSGGPEVDSPEWKRSVFEVFRNNWANPYYGGGDGQPGCFYDFYFGDVHFIMLDGRYYRNLRPEDRGAPTMLGPVQRAWLFDRIRNSRGRFLTLCSPVPWVFEAKGDSRDTWNGFQHERNEIFGLLAAEQIDGVVLMSADRHRSDLWKIDRVDNYPLYEFNSSRLTNQHVHPEMNQAEFSYNKKQSFGLVDFDTTLEDPTVTYRIVTIDGEEVFSKTVHLSELQTPIQ